MVAWVISKDADIDSFPGVLLVCGLLADDGEIFVLREGALQINMPEARCFVLNIMLRFFKSECLHQREDHSLKV